MARPSHVRVVSPDEAPPKLLSLGEAISSGDYLQILMAQRRDIANCLPDEKGPAKAALHRQLSLISKEIETLEIAGDREGSVVADTDDDGWDQSAI